MKSWIQCRLESLLILFLFLWLRSLRVEHKSSYPKGQIFTIWHCDLPAAMASFSYKKMCLLISASRDGQLASRVAQKLGYTTIAGSSSRGFLSLRKLLPLLDQGVEVGMALDGPKGPAGIAKPGTNWLQSKSKKQIFHIEIKYSRYWRLNSWDKMKIPLPFSKLQTTLSCVS